MWQRSPERPLCKAVKMKPRLVRDLKTSREDARTMGCLPRELQTGTGTDTGERSVLQTAKLERQSHLSTLTLYRELRDLEFAQLVLSLALVQFFLAVMYIWCHCMLEVLICFLILYGATIRRLT